MSETRTRRVWRSEDDVAGEVRASLDAVSGGASRIVVTRDGAPVAAIISTDDLLRLQDLDAQREEAFRPIREAWALFADVPPDEIEREVAKAIAEVRAEAQATARANGHA